MQTDDYELTERAREWISAVNGQFAGTPLPQEHEPVQTAALAFKSA